MLFEIEVKNNDFGERLEDEECGSEVMAKRQARDTVVVQIGLIDSQ